MAIASDTPAGDRHTSRWSLFGRSGLLLLALSAEILALSLAYDLQPLQSSPFWMLRVVGHGTQIFRTLAAAFIVFVVIKRRDAPTVLRRWEELATHDRAFALKCVGHVIAVTCFAVLSRSVLGEGGGYVTDGRAWLWMLAGGTAFILWLAALVPARLWFEIGRLGNLPAVAVSLVIGIVLQLLIDYSMTLWYPLSGLTLALSERILAFVAGDAVSNPATRMLGTSRFQVEIAPVCSGFEGVVLVALALTLFLILFRAQLRFPRSLVLVPFGIAAIWFCNVLRIVALILIGDRVSPAIAESGFHSQAGWIGFSVVTLGLAFVALRMPWFVKAHLDGARSSKSIPNLSAAYLLPLLAMIAAAMIAGAFSAGFDALYPLKVVAGVSALACFVPIYRRIPWAWSSIAVANGVAVFAIWLALDVFNHHETTAFEAGLQQLSPAWRLGWCVTRVLGSTLVVPMAEELACRGYLMRRMTNTNFERISYRECSWLAVVLSSLLFGLLHGRWFAGTLAGVLYAIAARRRNLLCDAVLAHSVTNGLIAAYVLASSSWQLWS